MTESPARGTTWSSSWARRWLLAPGQRDRATSGVLRMGERGLGPRDERPGVVARHELGNTTRHRDDADIADRMALELGPEGLEELPSVDGLGPRAEDGELAAAEAKRIVEAVRHDAEPFRKLEQHAVGREDADPRVERRQAVDVDDEQRQRLTRQARADDLALENGRERLPVEEVRQHVELRHDVRLCGGSGRV